MTLTSLSFFAFVLAVLIVYYVMPVKYRWITLLVGSFGFYGIVCLKYMPFIVFTILTTFGGAIWIEELGKKRKVIQKANKENWSKDEKKLFKKKTTTYKRLIMALVMVLNFGILAVLKYYNWIGESISNLFGGTFRAVELFLPLGISFYTFQLMGYIADVYWEKTSAERNIAKFALFASFFPQIIQGPIAIYNDLAHQLYEGHRLEFENIKKGAQLILWGLFMKMVIADRAVVALNTVLVDIETKDGFWNLFAIVIYALQLYTDFAGGINISRGVAQMFGITMAENFKRPFFSRTVAGFWRRWHISLCNWLKTYLFYPIAVSRPFLRMGKWFQKHIKGELGVHLGRVFPGCVATLITFFVIGMWHGANWKYAGYGVWNGIIIFISMLFEPVLKWLTVKLKLRNETFSFRVFQIARTMFLVVTSFAFDIAENLTASLSMIWKALSDPLPGGGVLQSSFLQLGISENDWLAIGIGVVILFCVSLYEERSGKHVRDALDKQQIWLQWVVTMGLFLAVVLMGAYGPGISASEFVYMNF